MRCRFLPILLLGLAALPTGAQEQDKRSIEVVRYDCTTDTTRREVTLFANGTVRVREGWIGNEWMGLTELGPDELQGFLNRLAGEDLSESRNPEKGVEGAWIERCELRLHLGTLLRADEALRITEDALTRTGKKIDAIVASNVRFAGVSPPESVTRSTPSRSKLAPRALGNASKTRADPDESAADPEGSAATS